ncbi:MAG: hypothetical protein ACP5G2_08515 [Candidatus Bipolaricaulaceae bacterium]
MSMRIAAVGLVSVVVSWAAIAGQASDPVVPQLLAGTAGGYLGGAVGAYALAAVLSAGAQGWDSLARAIFGAVLGYTGGAILGASGGVIWVGSLYGVQGDIPLCVLGAAAGSGLSLGGGLAVGWPHSFMLLAPPAAAAGATAGFHANAPQPD